MNGWLRDKMRALLSGLNRDDSVGTEPLDDDHGIPVYRHGLGYSIHAVDPFEAEAAKRGTEPLDDDGAADQQIIGGVKLLDSMIEVGGTYNVADLVKLRQSIQGI